MAGLWYLQSSYQEPDRCTDCEACSLHQLLLLQMIARLSRPEQWHLHKHTLLHPFSEVMRKLVSRNNKLFRFQNARYCDLLSDVLEIALHVAIALRSSLYLQKWQCHSVSVEAIQSQSSILTILVCLWVCYLRHYAAHSSRQACYILLYMVMAMLL
jgi:hypothetical protein